MSSLSDCLDNMDNLINSADHVKLWIEIFSDMCAVIASNRTEEEPRDNPSPLVGLMVNLYMGTIFIYLAMFIYIAIHLKYDLPLNFISFSFHQIFFFFRTQNKLNF